jgi:VIT1/CCC1 family predicted Fe2+/Mn2+ transporter
MAILVRAFLVEGINGRDETALHDYLRVGPPLHRSLGFETLPNQSTFWHAGTTASAKNCTTPYRSVLTAYCYKRGRIRSKQFWGPITLSYHWMVSTNKTIERWLWVAFMLFFGVIILARFLPTRPLVFVFPAWSLAVLAAVVGTLAAAVVAAFGYGWPTGVR